MVARNLLATAMLALTGMALAQSVPEGSTATTSAQPVIHTVTVGKDGNRYEPNTTFANAGDIVQFQFYGTNHSVNRAAYGLPCIPYPDSTNQPGFSSGHFITSGLGAPPTWNLTINDTQPIFYYCTALGSCTPSGMVGVINPNASVSLQAQYQQAIIAPYQLEYGQSFPAEGTPTPALTVNTALETSLPTPTSASASPSASSSSSGSSGLSGGAIAGIVVAAIALIVLLAAVFWLLGRQKSLKNGGAASSAGGNLRHERTENWAATTSQAGGDMYQKPHYDGNNGGWYSTNVEQVPASPGYQQPLVSPFFPPTSPGMHPQNMGNYQPPISPPPHQTTYQAPPMELGSTEVTELEAPHRLKQ